MVWFDPAWGIHKPAPRGDPQTAAPEGGHTGRWCLSGAVLHQGDGGQCDGKRFPLNDMQFDLSDPLERRVFAAHHDGDEVCHLTYSLYDHGYLDCDPTPFADMEHFDFGLYAVSAQDRARKL